MSELRWDPKSERELNAAQTAFNLFLKRDYRAYTPRGRELGSFNDAKGVAVFKKITRLSALERLLTENEDGNDRDEPRG